MGRADARVQRGPGVLVDRVAHDLFGAPPDGPNWRSLSAPLDRLAAFTADATNATARRREANSVIELFQRRDAERAARAALLPPNLHLVGMLMLVPPA